MIRRAAVFRLASAMTGFKGQFSEQEINDLVAYVRQLGGGHAARFFHKWLTHAS